MKEYFFVYFLLEYIVFKYEKIFSKRYLKMTRNKQLPKTLLPFIWYFLKDYKPVIVFLIILSASAGLWGPFNSILIRNLIDLLPKVQNNLASLMLATSLIVLNFIVFDNFTWRGLTYIRCRYIPVIINRVIKESMDYVLGKSPQFYQENLTGKISKQITNLADGIERITSSIVCNFIRGIFLLLTAISAAYFVNPIFCIIIVVWFLLFATISLSMSKKLISLSDAQASSEAIVVGELIDALSNHGNVRIFSRKSYERLRMIPFISNQQQAYSNVYFYSLIMNSIQGGLIAIMMACSCYFLVQLYGQNLVTVGDFALILGLSIDMGHVMWFIMSEIDEFNKAKGRCKQSLNSLMMPLEIMDKPTAGILCCDQGQIVFDRVKFYYNGITPLFNNNSITIKAKQKVGLVGYSGGGKTTFINLILRLYDINEGHILIDGQDIADVTQDSLRKNISMIPQDPSLFNRTIMENIRYGSIDATDEEIYEAAKRAHAHDFILRLSEGYETLAGEKGLKLSGGQRQRIAIARAILKDAPILMLDEATSQLDSITENLIQSSVYELMQGRTTLIIAHRLATILQMDRILFFNRGQIVEDGTHEELLQKNGFYKQLWDAQVDGFLKDERK